MINYLLINVLLTGGALAINHWMQIPHRIRFYLMMIAVIAWLFPFSLITIELTQPSFPILPAQWVQITEPVIAKNSAIPSSYNFMPMVFILMAIGLFRFVADLIASQIYIRKLTQHAEPLKNHENIRMTQGIDGACVSGYIKPIIWIDKKLQHSDTLPSVITHELQHIKYHDQFWLLIITWVQRLFWFNPLAFLVCLQCKKSIELSCDEACKNQLGQRKYQMHLAQLMIAQQQNSHALLNNQIHQNQRFNIHRIKQLEQENIMTKFKTTQLSIIVLSAFLMSTYSLITVANNTTTPELTEEQVLLEIEIQQNNEEAEKVTLVTRKGKMANVIYGNHDFGFTAQVMPNKPSQIYTEILISKIENGQKTEVSNPAILTADSEWAGIKFTEDEQYFEIKIMVQTSHGKDSVAVPPKPTSPPAPTAAPTRPELFTAPVTAPSPTRAPVPKPAPVQAPVPKPEPAPQAKLNN